MEIIPWGSYEERWSTGVAGGETPDIGYMYVEMYPTYISSGLVTDLSDMVEEEDYKEYLFLDRGEMMGGLYGVPIVTGVPFVLYYNQDILDSIGEKAPETWEDFARICEKATKDVYKRQPLQLLKSHFHKCRLAFHFQLLSILFRIL